MKKPSVMPLRAFGRRSGRRIAPVSLGGMRLPRDLDTAVDLVRHAIDSGMRYLDCSRGYGECEWAVGRALKDGYRRRVMLSTKWAPWCLPLLPGDDASAASVRRRIEESIRRLDVAALDFYQVWSTNNRRQFEQATARGGMVDGIRRARRDGLVRHIGMTTHDSVDNLLSYMDDLDWCESLLVSYNLCNRRYRPVLAAAHRRGIGTLVMNPVGGGSLAEPSPVLLKIARRVGARSVPDLAVRYILSNPDVDSILCGMTCRKDIDDTIRSALRRPFTAAQMKTIDACLDKLDPERAGFCTGCRYCMPCPQGINIPAVMKTIHRARFWGLRKSAAAQYAGLAAPRAEACNACGKCRRTCTQKLDIPREMAYAARTFAPARKRS